MVVTLAGLHTASSSGLLDAASIINYGTDEPLVKQHTVPDERLLLLLRK
jgi:hypothetical protein